MTVALMADAGAVMRWEHDGATAVAKERRGRNARPSGRQGISSERCAAVAEARAKEEARRGNESARENGRAQGG